MVQERFDSAKQLENAFNELFENFLASNFTLTLGDEFLYAFLTKAMLRFFKIIDKPCVLN